jgi:putative transcriptional regulator
MLSGMVTPLATRLLVATPRIGDPNFERTVVFMLAHGDQGALGVVLNRPSGSDAAELVPGWGERATEPGVIFLGGPVGRDAVVGMGLGVGADDEKFQPVLGSLGTVDLNQEPEPGDDILRVRLFAGSAGWGPGQLETEIDDGAWWVVPALVSDVLTQRPEGLWREVLRRQPSPRCWFANHPDDVSAN